MRRDLMSTNHRITRQGMDLEAKGYEDNLRETAITYSKTNGGKY